MTEEKTTEGSTTINQYPNNPGWGGAPYGGWGGYGYPVAVPAYGGYGNGFGDLMRGFGGNINIGRGGGMTGTALGLAIAALGLPVVGALSGRGFGWGGPNGPGCDLVTKDYVGMLEKNNALLAENGQLKAQIYTDNKIDGVVKTLVEWRQRQELIDTQTAADVGALKAENANLKATLGGMLGTYITPQAFGPSQAVFNQIQAKATATTGTGS